MKGEGLQFFDTTLRDGEQGTAFTPSPEQRQHIARSLDRAGVQVIELAYSEDDDERLARSREIALGLNSARVCCLARATAEDLETAGRFLDGLDRPRIHLYLDRRRLQQIHDAPEKIDAVLDPVLELLRTAKAEIGEVEFSPQDATRFPASTLAPVIDAALQTGADVISIADTVGTATPQSLRDLLQQLRAVIPALADATLSLHAHNHEGRALHNVLAAIECGVTQIEGTINGVGPAGGNTDLLEVIRSLKGNAGALPEYDRLRDVAALEPFQNL